MKSATKYPRTPHLPWSPGATSDDVYLVDLAGFDGRQVVVTEKMDGENTSLYRDGMHARSLDGRTHQSRNWVKRWHAGIAHEIPDGWRLCGENVFARHSVGYENLTHYFFLLSVWTGANQCLSWEETEQWAALLECPTPRVIYKGRWDMETVKAIEIDPLAEEGYVVRTTRGFAFDEFGRCVAKWVRPGHVQTDEHWMFAEVVPNKLAQGVRP